jgi:hypothetical protein
MWPEDLVSYPPFGTVKVNTRPDGIWGVTKSVATIKVHMLPDVWLDITPHHSLWDQEKLSATLQQMSRRRPITLHTPDGSITIKSMRSANWKQPKADMKGNKVRVFRPKTPNGKPDLFA